MEIKALLPVGVEAECGHSGWEPSRALPSMTKEPHAEGAGRAGRRDFAPKLENCCCQSVLSPLASCLCWEWGTEAALVQPRPSPPALLLLVTLAKRKWAPPAQRGLQPS